LVRLATNLYGRRRGDIGILQPITSPGSSAWQKVEQLEVWSPTPGVAATASSKRPASDIEVSTTNHPVDLKGQHVAQPYPFVKDARTAPTIMAMTNTTSTR
jgi:hypothetical protein